MFTVTPGSSMIFGSAGGCARAGGGAGGTAGAAGRGGGGSIWGGGETSAHALSTRAAHAMVAERTIITAHHIAIRQSRKRERPVREDPGLPRGRDRAGPPR